MIAEALRRLEAEYRRVGMAEVYGLIQPYLVGEEVDHFADLGVRLHKSEGAARVMVCRLRNHFRKLIRDVIADTVMDPQLAEIELQHLQDALRAD